MGRSRGIKRIDTEEDSSKNRINDINQEVESMPAAGEESTNVDLTPPDIDEDTFSFEDLSAAYSQLLQSREEAPRAMIDDEDDQNEHALLDSAASEQDISNNAVPLHEIKKSSSSSKELIDEDDGCPVTAKSILEALLFVGHPQNEPITVEQLTGWLRGVNREDIQQLVEELNAEYAEDSHAMEIVWQENDSLSMQIRQDLSTVQNAFHGKLRETRLNQSAVDCLALVAYNPGATREEIERLWNRPSGSVLSLLVRKELISLRREGTGKSIQNKYYPTERFLNLVGLASLQDLPRVDSDF